MCEREVTEENCGIAMQRRRMSVAGGCGGEL